MLQAIEAEIGTDGRVTLLEPIRPAHPVRAVVTLLAPVEAMPPEAFTAATLLELLDSPPFKNGPPGDPDAMEQIIAANRNAWEE